ncbi:MAG TPA: hypothetical protein VNQ76_20840 [Planctomicrobium sp.]|nr:hypothetical protein [Planctomicrobium sp.]
MATTLTIRTDIEQAQRGLKQLSRELDNTTDAAKSMGQDSEKAIDRMADSLESVEDQAGDAADALEEVASPGTIQSVEELRSLLDQASESAESVGESAEQAGQQAEQSFEQAGQKLDEFLRKLKTAELQQRQFNNQTRGSGQSLKTATDLLSTFTKGLGQSGLAGGVGALLPKLMSLTRFMGGPWGFVLSTGAGLLGSLTVEYLKNAKSAEENEKAQRREADAIRDLNDDLKEQISLVRERREASQQANEAELDRLTGEREDLANTIDELKRRREAAVDPNLSKQLDQQLATARMDLSEAERRSDELQFQIARQKTEANKAAAEEEKRRHEYLKRQKLAEELEEADRERERNMQVKRDLEQTLEVELDPHGSMKKRADEELAQRKKILEQAKLDNDEFVRLWEQAQEVHRRKMDEINKQIEAREQKLKEAELQKEAQLYQQHAEGIKEAIHGPDALAAGKQLIDQISPQQIAQEIAKQRTEQSDAQKKLDDVLYRQKNVGDVSDLDVRRAERELEQERRRQQRTAMQQMQRGQIDPNELAMAQSESVDALLRNSETNAQVSRQGIEAMRQAAQIAIRNEEELARQQHEIKQLKNVFEQITSNQKRRAQRGGGRG